MALFVRVVRVNRAFRRVQSGENRMRCACLEENAVYRVARPWIGFLCLPSLETLRFLHLIRPFMAILPEIAAPERKVLTRAVAYTPLFAVDWSGGRRLPRHVRLTVTRLTPCLSTRFFYARTCPRRRCHSGQRFSGLP